MTTQLNQKELCSLEQSNPLPTTPTSMRTARIWDRVADRYAKKPIADEATYAHKLAVTREYLHPDAHVLEIGCGSGLTALAHAPYVKHIRALDISSRMIEIAKSNAADQNVSNVEFECRDVDNMQMPEERYNVILMLNVLHLLADWRRHIAMSYSTLEPGGVLVLSILCMSDDLAYLRIPLSIARIVGLAPHLYFISQNELEYELSAVGFNIEHTSRPARKTAQFLIARKPR